MGISIELLPDGGSVVLFEDELIYYSKEEVEEMEADFYEAYYRLRR